MTETIANIAVAVVLAALTAAIIVYLLRAKKSGNGCVGCPYSKQCASKKSCTCKKNEEDDETVE